MLTLNPETHRHYERKIVVFFDILGWKQHVINAGQDPAQIGVLHTVLSMFSVFEGITNELQAGILTTFSDNVVISLPYNLDTLPAIMNNVASVQLGILSFGFLIRGAITIGDIMHTHDVTFGPALNRAYELESKYADYPRIILDNQIPELNTLQEPGLVREDAFLATNPFTQALIGRALANEVAPEKYAELKAKSGFVATSANNIPVPIMMQILMHQLALMHAKALMLEEAQRTKALRKIEWLQLKITNSFAR